MSPSLVAALVASAVALVVGLLAGWLLAQRAGHAADAVRAEAEERRHVELVRERAGVEAERASWAAERTGLAAVRDDLGLQLRTVTARAAAADAELAGDRERAAGDEERLRAVFASVSQQALAANSAQLLQLAGQQLRAVQETARGDLTGREQAIAALVAPVKEALGRLETHSTAIEGARLAAYAGLSEQVRSMREVSDGMRSETGQLVAALRSTSVRGTWGELQLRRVVELSGMLAHCDFDEQPTVRSEDGMLRPDMVVHLAGGKSVVIDSKVPLEAFLTAESTSGTGPGSERSVRYAEHARAVAGHVKRLADKRYWTQFADSPEFVVLFMPGDGLLAAAMDADPTLVEAAARAHVMLATPSTLIALLRTVAHVWKQDGLAASAAEVQSLARELYSRLATMGTHFAKLGTSLKATVDSYNKTVGSLEGRVLVTARKMHELHVGESPIEGPVQIDLVPRDPTAAELIASAEDALLDFDPGSQRPAAQRPGRSSR